MPVLDRRVWPVSESTLGTSPSHGIVSCAATASQHRTAARCGLHPELRATHTSLKRSSRHRGPPREVLTPKGPHGAVDYSSNRRSMVARPYAGLPRASRRPARPSRRPYRPPVCLALTTLNTSPRPTKDRAAVNIPCGSPQMICERFCVCVQ